MTLAPLPKSTFPFEGLPQELRDDIYRAYFDHFAEARGSVDDLRATAPTFLNLLHTNSKIRRDAGSIFNKRYLCADSFTAGWALEGELWTRIRSVCSLVAVRDVHLPMSITCTTYRLDDEFLRNSGLIACMETSRKDFLGRLQLIILDQELDYVHKLGVDLDDEDHPSRGFRTKFARHATATRSRAFETFCISGPLAELDWPDTYEGYGSDTEDEDFDGEVFQNEEFRDGDQKDENFKIENFNNGNCNGEDFEPFNDNLNEKDSQSDGEDLDGEDFDREDFDDVDDEDSGGGFSLFGF